ncbi:MAG TPA: PIN domain-containing protein [Baekduia sp.]
MPYKVVLDANVLFPLSLRDLLLRLAEQELFEPVWSERILDEMTRNLVKTGKGSPEQADALRRVMQTAFPEAAEPPAAIAALVPAMTNDPGDRHVLACAVASKAEGILTSNLKHFPSQSVDPFGIDVRHPDEFLCALRDMFGDIVIYEVRELAAALRKPPRSVEYILDSFQLHGLPEFVAVARRTFELPERTRAQILESRKLPPKSHSHV